MLTGQWMGDREIVVHGNRSGESALGVDLYEIPQWTFLDVQGLAEGSWGPERRMWSPIPFGPLVGLSETQSFKGSITDDSRCWEIIKQVSNGFHNQVALCRWWRRWWRMRFYLFTEKRNSFSPSFFLFSHTFMLYCWKCKYWNMERGRKRGKMKRRKEKEIRFYCWEYKSEI